MNQSENGFTFVEVLIAAFVGLLIMAAVYGLLSLGQGSSAGVSRKVTTQQDARAVLDFMAMEIRMASFNPTMAAGSTIWTSVPACAALGLTTAVAARKGIQIAGDNRILVAMDLGRASNQNDPDGLIGTAASEYIGYDYSNGVIKRYISCNGETILGGGTTGTNVVNDAVTPMFRYFDAAGNDISDNVTTAATADANIPLIRRIRITIVVQVTETQGKYNKTNKTYFTDVLVRNHVLSP